VWQSTTAHTNAHVSKNRDQTESDHRGAGDDRRRSTEADRATTEIERDTEGARDDAEQRVRQRATGVIREMRRDGESRGATVRRLVRLHAHEHDAATHARAVQRPEETDDEDGGQQRDHGVSSTSRLTSCWTTLIVAAWP